MSSYRKIYQCKHCGKVYRSSYYLHGFSGEFYADYVCKKCGSIDKIEATIGKPKLFGLLGWVVKNNKEENE